MALPRTPFWFLRHGETDYNAAGLSQGALDISLNANGRAQARAAGERLPGRGIVGIVSSPMRRTRETTALANESLNLPVTFEPELHEVVFGGMEGKPLLPWFPDWLEGRATPEGAESFAALTARVDAAMQRVLALPGPLLVVAHGGVFRAIRDLMGMEREALTPNGALFYCEPVAGGWRLRAPE